MPRPLRKMEENPFVLPNPMERQGAPTSAEEARKKAVRQHRRKYVEEPAIKTAEEQKNLEEIGKWAATKSEEVEMERIGKWAAEKVKEQTEQKRREKTSAELRKNLAEVKARRGAEKARQEATEQRERERISHELMETEKRKLIAKTPLEDDFFADIEKYLGEAEAEKQDDQREQYLVFKRRLDMGMQLTDKEAKLFVRLRDWADVYLARLGALRDLKDQEKKIDRLEAEKPKGLGGFFKKLVRPLTMGSEYNKLAALRDTYLDHFGVREVGEAPTLALKTMGFGPTKQEGTIFGAGEKKQARVAREESEEMMEATREHAKKHSVSEEESFFAKKIKKPKEQPREVIELAERLEDITIDSKDILPESQQGGGAVENGRLTLAQAGEKLNGMREALKKLGGGKVRLDPEFLQAYQSFVQAEEYVAQANAAQAKKQRRAKKEIAA